MNTRPDENFWNDIADALRDLGIDFSRRTTNLVPQRRKVIYSPPTKSKPGSGISMATILDDGSLTPQIDDGHERNR